MNSETIIYILTIMNFVFLWIYSFINFVCSGSPQWPNCTETVVKSCPLLPQDSLVVGPKASTNTLEEITSAGKAKKTPEQAQHLNRYRMQRSSLQQLIHPRASLPFVLQRRTMPAVRRPHQSTVQHQLSLPLLTDHEDHSKSLPVLSSSYVSTIDQQCPTVHSCLEELHLASKQTRSELKNLCLLQGQDTHILRKEKVFRSHEKYSLPPSSSTTAAPSHVENHSKGTNTGVCAINVKIVM